MFEHHTTQNHTYTLTGRAAPGEGTRLRGVAPGAGAALGIYAKYKNKTEKVDPDTGEVEVLDPMATRVQRFMLQAVARSLFPKSRIDKCLRIRNKSQEIQVWKSKEHNTAHYSGLQTCGSVWRCPVCSAKIAERRRVEIAQAMDAHKAAGGCVNMLTLTCPHQAKDNLADLLKKQAKALNSFWADRQVKGVLAAMESIGQIRALEVTHGRKSEQNNGWHPHYHVLIFGGAAVDLARRDVFQWDDWQTLLFMRWVNACMLAGLGAPSRAHGLKLDDGSKAAQYVSKWGLEDEMTKGHSKKAKAGGETPFDLLRAALADDGDMQARALFQEFAQCFKGKRQLSWSNGLKARFNQAEKTDEELAAEQDDRAVLLGLLTVDQWRDVLKLDLRGPLLEIASKGGWEAVQRLLHFVDGARDMPPPDAEYLEMLAEVRTMLCAWESCAVAV